MQLIPFNIDKHYETLCDWMAKRNQPIPNRDELPKEGCIVTEQGKFVATGFLRNVEGGFAIVDGFASNPNIKGIDRHKAMDMITTKLIKYAKYKNLKGLISNSVHKNTIIRAQKHGFKLVPNVSFVLDLRSR